MSIAVTVPERLHEKAVKRGIDVKSALIELLLSKVGLDPEEEISMRLELAEKYLREAEEYLAKSDTVQSSEKLYKAAEERIKAMAMALSLGEAEGARERGRWTLRLLDSAARRLAEAVDTRVYDDWDHAYFLHVEGFHEARLSTEHVRARVKYVAELERLTCTWGAAALLGSSAPGRLAAYCTSSALVMSTGLLGR